MNSKEHANNVEVHFISSINKEEGDLVITMIILRARISPSIFDVTFEVGANKCRLMQCDQCPFGDNELCHKGRQKFCSVVSWLFSYYEKDDWGRICNPENCPIGRDLGKNLCTREIDREITH